MRTTRLLSACTRRSGSAGGTPTSCTAEGELSRLDAEDRVQLRPGQRPVASSHRGEHFCIELDLVEGDSVMQAQIQLPGNLAHLHRRGTLSAALQVTFLHLSSA